MKTGFGVSTTIELLVAELDMVGVEVDVIVNVEDDADIDELLVLFVLELVGVGFAAG
jgi:2-phospho-L-lactate transferase/gluconeogenesis factor (CofD/UPF0052 family)